MAVDILVAFEAVVQYAMTRIEEKKKSYEDLLALYTPLLAKYEALQLSYEAVQPTLEAAQASLADDAADKTLIAELSQSVSSVKAELEAAKVRYDEFVAADAAEDEALLAKFEAFKASLADVPVEEPIVVEEPVVEPEVPTEEVPVEPETPVVIEEPVVVTEEEVPVEPVTEPEIPTDSIFI